MATIRLNKTNKTIKVVNRTDKISLKQPQNNISLKQTGRVGPKGGTGATGPQGPTGSTGPAGAGLNILGTLADPSNLPPQGNNGDAYIIDGELWVWDGDSWNNTGSIQGPAGPTGSSGPNGASGATGATGPQGSTGPSGPIGGTGSQGATGDRGFTGPSGPQGAQGNTGAAGATGSQGASGATGPIGNTGAQGSSGIRGATGSTGPEGATGVGSTGATGSQGLSGATGPMGPQGATGTQGIEGEVGSTGSTGPQGLQGNQGSTGAQGSTGPKGDTGNTGANGATGSTGPQGSSGVTGATGAQGFTGVTGGIGATGAIGTTGATGVQGLQGFTGPQGLSGNTGSTGPAGIDGVTGATGPKGDSGTSVTILGTFDDPSELPTTGNTNGDAYLIDGDMYVWDGTEWNNVGTIQGPQGNTGSQGIQGVTGPTGPIGLSGATGSTGPKGDTGSTGAIGITGATGPQGSTGSQGPQGNTGSQGTIGSTGPTGANGSQGATGTMGATGVQGAEGTTGATGPSGVQGGSGATGSTGPSGMQGFTGSVGATGADGNDGEVGATGSQGVQGATGPQGATGSQGFTGAKGDTGNTGSIGFTGPQGLQGNTGASGIDGGTGATGPQGDDGNDGATGATGPEGATGPAGSGVDLTFENGITNDGDVVKLGGEITDTASQTQIRYASDTDGLFIGPTDGTGGAFQVNDGTAQFTFSSISSGSSSVSLYPALMGMQATSADFSQDNVLLVTPTDIQSFAYPNSRNDSSSTTPTNFLYTTNDGTFKSAPVANIASNKVDKNTLLYNVKDYGATGNGTTDDTAAIQAALDAAFAAGGATVFFPSGTYLVNGTLNVYSSTTIAGASMDNGLTTVGATIRAGAGSGPVVSIAGTAPGSGDTVSPGPIKRVTIRDITIRGTGTSRTLLRAFYTNRNNLKNVRFVGTSGNAVHGVEFWDTTFDACTFDITGSDTNPSVILQNRSTSTASTLGYSNDNINRLTFRGCTWETFTSTCIALDATSNSSTHLINNITIDDCKFETSTFQNPYISTTNRVASVYILNSYFAANNKDSGYSGGAKDMITASGSSLMLSNSRFYQGVTGLVTSAIHFTDHSGQNMVNGITCNWSSFAPSQAAVWIETPATPSEDSVTNVRVDVGKKLVDTTGASSFKSHQALMAEADQTPNFIWSQTGTNPKKITLGVTASGNFSMIPDNGALWTVKKADNTNFAVFDMINGRLAGGTNSTNVAPTAGLFAAGSIGQAVTVKTSSFTFAETDGVILATTASGAMVATLPNATLVKGRILEIKKVDASANNITVTPVSSQTIDGATTKVLSGLGAHGIYISDGTNWVQLSPTLTTGATGPAGATGPQGATGAVGATGVAGVQGFTGPSGASGVAGATGAQGATGPAGASGVAGASGIQGSTGPQGPTGIQGATGVAGSSGVAGASGIQGATGPSGASGPAGSNGATGATGPVGATGAGADVPFVGTTAPASPDNGELWWDTDDNSGTAAGNVVGPSSATNESLAVYDGTTGKLIKNSTVAIGDVVTLNGSQTLASKSLTSPTVTGTMTVPASIVANTFTVAFPGASTTMVGRSTVDTMTNKRITPRVGTTASGSTITPVGDDNDMYTVTALAANATIAAPSGTPTNGQKLMLRIKDNATARTLTWNSIYRAIGVTLPTTTVISKTTYIGIIYNSADTKWDVIAVGTEA